MERITDRTLKGTNKIVYTRSNLVVVMPYKYIGETSRQLNVSVKGHKLCLKHIPKCKDDSRKLENKSQAELHSMELGHTIGFIGTGIL